VLSRHAHERGDAFRVDGDATAVVGRVLAHVGDEQGPARVFIAAGGGMVRHTGTVAFTSGPQVAPASYEATGGLLALGFGVDIGAGRRWFIRPELQVRIARLERPSFGPEPPYATGLASVTIGWRP
jgi:hypothetical protein